MIPYRCHHCDTRVAKARMPLDYAKAPVCRACGYELRVDYYRLRRRDKGRRACQCGAAPYPHRAGLCAAGWYHGESPADRAARRAGSASG